MPNSTFVRYKINGLINSPYTEIELSDILDALGFFMYKLDKDPEPK